MGVEERVTSVPAASYLGREVDNGVSRVRILQLFGYSVGGELNSFKLLIHVADQSFTRIFLGQFEVSLLCHVISVKLQNFSSSEISNYHFITRIS